MKFFKIPTELGLGETVVPSAVIVDEYIWGEAYLIPEGAEEISQEQLPNSFIPHSAISHPGAEPAPDPLLLELERLKQDTATQKGAIDYIIMNF